MALSDFPRYPLTFGPSPVHRLERLTAHLGGPTIWAKREDCNSGLAYGGNKTRKLECLGFVGKDASALTAALMNEKPYLKTPNYGAASADCSS